MAETLNMLEKRSGITSNELSARKLVSSCSLPTSDQLTKVDGKEVLVSLVARAQALLRPPSTIRREDLLDLGLFLLPKEPSPRDPRHDALEHSQRTSTRLLALVPDQRFVPLVHLSPVRGLRVAEAVVRVVAGQSREEGEDTSSLVEGGEGDLSSMSARSEVPHRRRGASLPLLRYRLLQSARGRRQLVFPGALTTSSLR